MESIPCRLRENRHLPIGNVHSLRRAATAEKTTRQGLKQGAKGNEKRKLAKNHMKFGKWEGVGKEDVIQEHRGTPRRDRDRK